MCEVCIFSLCNVIHILPRDDVASVVRRRRKRAELKWNTVWCDDLMCDIHSNDKFGFEVYLGKKSSKDVALSSFRLQGKHSENYQKKIITKTFSFCDCWLFSFFILCVFFFCRVCFCFCFPTLFDRCCCAAAQTSTFHHHLSPRALLSAHVHLMGRHSVRWWDEEPTKSIEKHSLELSSFCRPQTTAMWWKEKSMKILSFALCRCARRRCRLH